MERFWARVERGDGCWEWRGTRRRDGYGQLMVNGKLIRAHRLAYELSVGPIPPGLSVCHRCDNPPCVRPDHLWLGSRAENLADMTAKGRRRHFMGRPQAGSLNHNAKLTEDDIRVMRLMASQYTQRAIAERFGIGRANVSLIIRGKTWRHVA